MKIAVLAFLTFLASISYAQEIKWMSWEEASNASEKNQKKLFVDVYTNWCGWCKKMDANTFTHPIIVELMNKYFYAVKFNAEGKDIIVHQGKEYKNEGSGRSTHEFAPFILKEKLSYPTIVMFSETQDSYGPIPGYQSPKNLEPMLIFIGEEHFKTQKWDEFIANFKSEIH